MLKIIVFLLLASVGLPSVTHGVLHPKGKTFVGFPEGATAAGIFLGEPIGLRGYLFRTWKQAYSVGVGYSNSKVIQGSFDYLFYGYSARDKLKDKNLWNSLIFYGGPGLLVGTGLEDADSKDKFQVGARVVGGSEYIFTDSPLSLRLELAPQFMFKGRTALQFSMGVGLTYYFDTKKRSRYKRRSKSRRPRARSAREDELREFE